MLLAIAFYLALQFGIGVYVSRRIHTESDYLIAGRNLGYLLATFSIFATWFGAETVVGSAGLAYDEGLSVGSAEPFGYGLCLLLMGLLFARPLWRRKLTTLADLFRQRYGTTVERTAAIILIPSSILWAGAQVRAFGHVLSTSSGALDVDVAIAVAAGFTILYTMFGGLLVDAITDVLQGGILILGILIVFVMVIVHFGGIGEFTAVLAGAQQLHIEQREVVPLLATLEAWAIPVCGSVVATELVGRVIATRNPNVARNSSLLAGGLYLLVGCMPVAIGLAGSAIVGTLPDSELVIPTVAQSLLPGLLYVIFAGALISAILSTVDSTLLVSSGLLSHNVIVPIFGIRDEAARVRVARVAVLAFGVIAYVLAIRAEGVFALVEQASAFGSSGSLVLVCFALWTRIGGPATAFATLIIGVMSYVIATYTGADYPFLISLGSALGTYVGGALIERFIGVTVPAIETSASIE